MTSNNRRSASRPAPGATDAMYPSFIRQAADAPRLTREEERELIGRWQRSRDRKAAEKLARCSMRYVVAIACKYRRYNVPIDVLISEGNLGLVRAMDKFDLEQENRFSTYATYWIRYYVLDHIMRSWSIVGGGSGALKTRLFFRLRRERARAWSLFGEGEVADRAVAARLELEPSELSKLAHQLDSRDSSLNVAVREDSSTLVVDTLAVESDQAQRFERAQRLHALSPILHEAVRNLNARERAIVEQRLMADPEEEESLSKLGETFGVSRERVRQIEEALKKKLRHFISQHRVAEELATG